MQPKTKKRLKRIAIGATAALVPVLTYYAGKRREHNRLVPIHSNRFLEAQKKHAGVVASLNAREEALKTVHAREMADTQKHFQDSWELALKHERERAEQEKRNAVTMAAHEARVQGSRHLRRALKEQKEMYEAERGPFKDLLGFADETDRRIQALNKGTEEINAVLGRKSEREVAAYELGWNDARRGGPFPPGFNRDDDLHADFPLPPSAPRQPPTPGNTSAPQQPPTKAPSFAGNYRSRPSMFNAKKPFSKTFSAKGRIKNFAKRALTHAVTTALPLWLVKKTYQYEAAKRENEGYLRGYQTAKSKHLQAQQETLAKVNALTGKFKTKLASEKQKHAANLKLAQDAQDAARQMQATLQLEADQAKKGLVDAQQVTEQMQEKMNAQLAQLQEERNQHARDTAKTLSTAYELVQREKERGHRVSMQNLSDKIQQANRRVRHSKPLKRTNTRGILREAPKPGGSLYQSPYRTDSYKPGLADMAGMLFDGYSAYKRHQRRQQMKERMAKQMGVDVDEVEDILANEEE